MNRTIGQIMTSQKIRLFLAILGVLVLLVVFTANGDSFGEKIRFEPSIEMEDLGYDPNALFFGYNDERLIIREEPKKGATKVGRYESYSLIEVLEDLGEWYKVPDGYVMSKYVILIDDPDGVPSPVDSSEQVTLSKSNMPYLAIRYVGTLAERTQGDGVTTKKSLKFIGDIPIYEIKGGYAYFPSGREIYKIDIEKFSELKDVGPDQEILDCYRTVYHSSTDSRKHNIRLCASLVDGTVIEPGKTFSFNQTTGPRGKKQGYKKANVISSGKVVQDYGGGVCQVSSTVYAAIMNDRNIKVTARTEHGLEVTYLPVGMDATVSYDRLDLKFKNKYEFPIKINIHADDGAIIVYIMRF